MNHPDVADKAREILSLVLERPVGQDEPISRENEARWDSLRHIEVIFAVEAAFGVRFSEEDAAGIVDIPTLVGAVERRRAP